MDEKQKMLLLKIANNSIAAATVAAAADNDYGNVSAFFYSLYYFIFAIVNRINKYVCAMQKKKNGEKVNIFVLDGEH